MALENIGVIKEHVPFEMRVNEESQAIAPTHPMDSPEALKRERILKEWWHEAQEVHRIQ